MTIFDRISIESKLYFNPQVRFSQSQSHIIIVCIFTLYNLQHEGLVVTITQAAN